MDTTNNKNPTQNDVTNEHDVASSISNDDRLSSLNEKIRIWCEHTDDSEPVVEKDR